MEGVPASEVKDELNANAARREELKAKLAAADAPPPLLHPEMAGLYRQKVTALAEALEHPEPRTEASEALRGLIDAIVLTPNQGELQIELKGNLAAMLGAAQNAKRSPETGDLSLQVSMVAGGMQPTILACSWTHRSRSSGQKVIVDSMLDSTSSRLCLSPLSLVMSQISAVADANLPTRRFADSARPPPPTADR